MGNKNESNTYDIAIIGAGPAGLGTAIAAKKAGAKRVLVLEKGFEIGHTRKGEGIREDSFIIERLGFQLFEENRINSLTHTRFFSPSGKNQHVTENLHPVSIIHHDVFLKKIAEIAEAIGVQILLATAVKDFIIQSKECKGLKIEQKGEEKQIYAKAVVAAGSISYPSYRFSSENKEAVYSPVLKLIYENIKLSETNYFDVYTNGRDFPKGIVIFPYDHSSGEVCFSCFPNPINPLMPFPKTELEVISTYRQMIGGNALLQKIFANGKIKYQTFYRLPLLNEHKEDDINICNLFRTEGRENHITALLGYGVSSSLHMGLLLGNLIGEQVRFERPFDSDNRQKIDKNIQNDPFYQDIKASYSFSGILRNSLSLVPPEFIDTLWPIFKLALNHSSHQLGI
ncbi:MAG: FAD-dependent oxidoreductase [Spirochaetota bacterium]